MISPFRKSLSPTPVTTQNLSDYEWQGLDSCIIAVASMEPPAGRRIACLYCRRAKKRCDHKWPRCSACEFYNTQCYYPRPVTKRRPKRNISMVTQNNNEVLKDVVTQLKPSLPPPRPSPPPAALLPSVLTCTRAAVGSTRADPFSSFPIPMGDSMNFLLDHFATHLASKCDPVAQEFPLRRELLPRALGNLTLLHSVLSLGGMHYMVISGHRDAYTQTLAHRGEALRLLNSSLRDPSFKADVNTIAAILLLSGNEMLAGEANPLKSHINGLTTMIKAHGGSEALGIQGVVAELLIWVDQLCSISTGSKLQFQPPKTSPRYREILTSISQKPSSFPTFTISETRFENLPIDPHTSQILIDIICSYKFLRCNPPRDQGVFFNDLRSSIFRRLTIDESAEGTRHPIQECIRLTAIMHINLVFRGLPIACAVHTRIARKIKILLHRLISPNASSLSFRTEVKEVCLWIAFIAGSTLIELPLLREWYVWFVRELLRELRLGVGNWMAIKEVLKGFIWEHELWEPAAKRLWDEVRTGLEGNEKIEELDFELDLGQIR